VGTVPRTMGSRLRRALGALRDRPEAALLLAMFFAVLAALAFIALADEVAEGDLGAFDRWALRAARAHVVRSADSIPGEIALDLTALGSYPVLTLLVLCVLGLLSLRRMAGRALYVLCAVAGGALLSQALKAWFVRPRPMVVEPLVRVDSWSFPSGHALASAVAYMTLGALIAASVEQRATKLYVLAMALTLTGVIGVSRVLLGVHYPTDVLAGWLAGLGWSSICWSVFALFEQRNGRARS